MFRSGAPRRGGHGVSPFLKCPPRAPSPTPCSWAGPPFLASLPAPPAAIELGVPLIPLPASPFSSLLSSSRPPSLTQGPPLPFTTSVLRSVQPGVSPASTRLQAQAPNFHVTSLGGPIGTPTAHTGAEPRPPPTLTSSHHHPDSSHSHALTPCPRPSPYPPALSPSKPLPTLSPHPEPEAWGQGPSQTDPGTPQIQHRNHHGPTPVLGEVGPPLGSRGLEPLTL